MLKFDSLTAWSQHADPIYGSWSYWFISARYSKIRKCCLNLLSNWVSFSANLIDYPCVEYSISYLELNEDEEIKQQQFLPCWTVISEALAVDIDSFESTFIKQCAAVNTMFLVRIDPLHVRGPWMTEKLIKYNLPSKSSRFYKQNSDNPQEKHATDIQQDNENKTGNRWAQLIKSNQQLKRGNKRGNRNKTQEN